jgi:hypothetical protein
VHILGLYEAIARAPGGTFDQDFQYQRELPPGGCWLWKEF